MTRPKSIPPVLRCPRCRSAIERDVDPLQCANGHVVPALGTILDCRGVIAGFDVEADRGLAEELLAMGEATFEELLRHYWSRQVDVAAPLAERFVHGDLIGLDRATAVVDQIEELLGGPLEEGAVVLEIGAGTAALGAAIALRAGHVVATDISLAWLTLAARRLTDEGIENVTLVACTADRLPFASGEFDLVVAADVIEHVPDPLAMARSCYHVVRPGGALWLSTPNRLSLTPEPHVRVWGVGLMPRPWGRRLVRRVRGVPYDVHTHSVFELRRTLGATGGAVRVSAPAIAPALRAGYRPTARLLIGAYHVARELPVARSALLGVTPLFHATVEKRKTARSG